MAIVSSTLTRIKSDPLLPLGGADRVNELFAQAGYVWRDRLLNPATTLGLFILQVLHGNTAITHLRHLCRIAVCPSSYCDARARLPLAAMGSVIETLCRECITSTQSVTTWIGRRVLIADGTSCTTPDTPALQSLWPQPAAQKPGCGFPLVKLLALVDLATGLIHQVSVFSQRLGEMSQTAAMHAMMRAGDVLLADRGFCSFVHLVMLALKNIDAVFRMHQAQIVDFTPHRARRGRDHKRHQKGRPTSRFIRRLGAEDQLVEWIKPLKKPGWMCQQDYDQLPATLTIRELRYRITLPGRRTRIVTIATTLLDPTRYPKRAIAKLYGLRWEIETNFRHLKQTMKMDQLKCQTPDGVMKELLVFMLVYNLIRAAMCAAAGDGVDPNRVSFIDTVRCLCSTRVRALTVLIVNPLRINHWSPRVRKRRMKEYDLMTKPRSQYMQPQPEESLTA